MRRHGRPAPEVLAAIAAAYRILTASAAPKPTAAAASRWKRAARLEAVGRGDD
ncbi:MAG TPA: hypothetical protein VGN14_15060 [Candidatus Elarobacter sp.]